jgi:DNA-binding LacI/PurR family transcriptional regulator
MSLNKKSRPTSTQVARRAGVSRTAVSFVLNNVIDQGISAATRERVLQAARELGYEPNAAARMLATGTTGTVAIVIPSATHLYADSFLAQLFASVNEVCRQQGLKLLVESTEDEGQEAGGFVNLVRSRSIDGLLMVNLRTTEHEHLQRLRDAGVPIVLFGRNVTDVDGIYSTGVDSVRSARIATEHLMSLGHERIAYVSFAKREYHSVSERERGWREALEARGIEVDPALAEYADIDAKSGYLATRRLIERRVKFTALFAGNDTIAFGAIKALTEAGLRVPHDVALIGYDDIPLAAFATPSLTTMRTDPVGGGRDAMQALLAQMQGKAPDKDLLVQRIAELVVRDSCGANLAAQAKGRR